MIKLKNEIILLYNSRSGRFEDRTDQLLFVQERGRGYLVRFKSKDRLYNYNKGNILKALLQQQFDPGEYEIYINGEICSTIAAIGKYGKFWGVIYHRERRLNIYKEKEVVLKRARAKVILKYLAEIASYMHDNPLEEDEQNLRAPFLSREFRKIRLNKETLLDPYLNGEPIIKRSLPKNIIYPFAVNRTQKEAIKKALSNNVSIIQGPPGTGKTQSILNLIANLIVEGKSIGVVSSNNSAIENVKEKLEEEGYGFLIAHLGNSSNRISFFSKPDEELPIERSWALSAEEVQDLQKELITIEKKLENILKKKEELAIAKEKLKEIKRQEKAFKELFGNPQLSRKYKAITKWDSDKIENFTTLLKWFPDKFTFSNLGWYLSNRIKFGYPFRSGLKEEKETFLLALDSLRFTREKRELTKLIERKSSSLFLENSEEEFTRSKEISNKLFKALLYNRFSTLKREKFQIENYANTRFESFIRRYPLILSTTHSILSSISKPLDYIIIDESSQVDLVTASLAMSVAKSLVIIGDQQQLSHVVNHNIRDAAEEVNKKYNIAEEYNYINENIISSFTKLYSNKVPSTLLKEHYRCNPLIIGFCSQKYYNGELIPMKNEPEELYNDDTFPLRLLRTVPGEHARDNINERQIAAIEQEILPKLLFKEGEEEKRSGEDIGIITPYRNQADQLAQLLCNGNPIEADTIHRFQGREKREIIFSTVANEITDFMDQAELVNVAVSRAKEQFIMVMPHSYSLPHGSNIGDLIRYIEHWNPFGTIQSKILSYFDLLKTEHSTKLEGFKRRVEGSSHWESENIIESVIKAILKEDPLYSGFSLLKGYPLYLLTPNKEGLNKREIAFSNHRLSHVDFLIVNRCDNTFILAIEVDGYTYHSQEKQKERDSIKDKALKLNGIELLRLSTRGYQESNRIRKKLKEVISFEQSNRKTPHNFHHVAI